MPSDPAVCRQLLRISSDTGEDTKTVLCTEWCKNFLHFCRDCFVDMCKCFVIVGIYSELRGLPLGRMVVFCPARDLPYLNTHICYITNIYSRFKSVYNEKFRTHVNISYFYTLHAMLT